jgi:cytochrome c oxidase subunit II
MRSQLSGNQSALNPFGPHAGSIAEMSWIYLGGFLVVWIVVMGFLGFALYRSRRGRFLGEEGSHRLLVWAGFGVPLAVLVVFLIHSVVVGNRLDAKAVRLRDALQVKIIGKQWWWDVYYEQGDNQLLRTANEIHIPTGRPVVFELESTDVIHSFWVPTLAGKRDLIPGRTNYIWLRADTPGVYRGQCAEYCGRQHAHMGFEVIAESPDQFRRWIEEQRKPAIAPTSESALRGQQVFVTGPCALCHQIRGTQAGAQFGPDLTHVASRDWIAAATVPHSRGSMAGWVSNAQSVKPGAYMPNITLSPQELQDVLNYLEGLQ